MSQLEEVREIIRKEITHGSSPDFDKIGLPSLEELRSEILSVFDVKDYTLHEYPKGDGVPIRYFTFKISLPETKMAEIEKSLHTEFQTPDFSIVIYENSSQLILQTILDNTMYHRVFTLNGYLRRLKYNPVKEEMEKYSPIINISNKYGSSVLDRQCNPESELELERAQNVKL